MFFSSIFSVQKTISRIELHNTATTTAVKSKSKSTQVCVPGTKRKNKNKKLCTLPHSEGDGICTHDVNKKCTPGKEAGRTYDSTPAEPAAPPHRPVAAAAATVVAIFTQYMPRANLINFVSVAAAQLIIREGWQI